MVDFRGHHRVGCAPQSLGIQLAIGARQGEPEALQRADEMAFEPDFALAVDFGRCHTFVFQVAEQHAGASVDEPLGQALMQRIAQAVFDFTRLFAPMGRVFKPVFAVGDKGPGPDLPDPLLSVSISPEALSQKRTCSAIQSAVTWTLPPQVGIDAGDDFAVRGG